ncbi:hypothetical protein [Rubritalea tangerina]|uniref:hypothetical protein n=1 Tax=Rubritalea tangerina TaxID=430798 RepID=UPI0036210C75
MRCALRYAKNTTNTRNSVHTDYLNDHPYSRCIVHSLGCNLWTNTCSERVHRHILQNRRSTY